MTISLNNLSVRIVGAFFRINIHPNPVISPPARYKPTISLTQLDRIDTGPRGHATVATVMQALSRVLPDKGYDLELTDYDMAPRLDRVRFGPTGSQEPFVMSARTVTASMSECGAYCPSGRSLIASWQYKLRDAQGMAVPLAGRPSYHDSPPVTDGMTITWRLVITYGSPMSTALQTRREDRIARLNPQPQDDEFRMVRA